MNRVSKAQVSRRMCIVLGKGSAIDSDDDPSVSQQIVWLLKLSHIFKSNDLLANAYKERSDISL